ncbi:quinol dehydrogenase ferredoxin subunit NapH [Methylorubrum populi]|uniref:Quinol dehydrogenase ferredoxin subunit NapH n=1 Tax=Methylobacterium radiotolerans TaxID=31998 RepID=A0ABU7T3V2_9HYPH
MRLSLTAAARAEGVTAKGWLRAHKWWFLRRLTQITALAVFMAGPFAGLWLVRGNFASSEILGVLPLSDPFIALQSLAAGMVPASIALLGAGLIALFYVIVGGRAYCGWICPVNVVTDAAYWLREKLGITRDRKLDRRTRLWVLAGALLASLLSGTIAWEFVNPVSLLQRGLIFGLGAGWTVIAAVFLLDLLITRRGWCGHLCPVGAFYGLVGKASLVRVAAMRRADCTNCGACFQICTEPHVITPALKGTGSILILSGDCVNCGSCIDACPVDVFEMARRGRSMSPK